MMKVIRIFILCLITVFCLMACGDSNDGTNSESDGVIKFKKKGQIIEEVDKDGYAFKIRISRLGDLSNNSYGMSLLVWDVYGVDENTVFTVDNIVVNGIEMDDEWSENLINNEEKNMGLEDGVIGGPVLKWSPDNFEGEIETISFHINISSDNQTYLDKDYVVEK